MSNLSGQNPVTSRCFFVVVLNLLLWSAPRIIALNRCDNGTEGERRNIAELMLIISPVTGSHTPHFSTHKCGALIASCCSRDIYILYIVYYIEETKLVLIQYKTKSQGSQMVVLFAKWPSSLGLQHNTYYQHQLSNSVLRGLMSVDICVMFSMSSQNPILSI